MTGILISGPFSLITTAVSAELGQHESLKGSSKATATVTNIFLVTYLFILFMFSSYFQVTAIIDGCGSIGATVGPLLCSRR